MPRGKALVQLHFRGIVPPFFFFDKDFFFYFSSDVVNRCRVGNESLIVEAMVKTLGGKNE